MCYHVAVISGGGSGHEPTFTGLVGQGFLTTSVAGTIFASPSTEQILHAIVKCSETSKGVLAIVMNYTVDVLNFGVAVEKARTMGIEVDMLVVGRSKGGKVGRRGIAGTVLVQKIACALAAQGRSLQDIAAAARLAAANTASIGVSLTHVHVPGRSDTSRNPTEVNKGDAELGMGVHNETGSSFEKAGIAGLVKKTLKRLLDIDDKDRSFLQVSAPIVLMVNNLGGVSVLELDAITAVVGRHLASDYNICPVRVLSGTYMTSLNGMGFSITLLNLEASSRHDLLELLYAPAQAVGWSAPISPEAWRAAEATVPHNHMMDEEKPKMRPLIQIENAADVGTYDAVFGYKYPCDGNCGIGLKKGAEAVLHHVLD
ncbi:hypothetical protein FAGAP_1972 [Fusarium agapanthi]|uniref:DhaK domain-containing protein n=1 Tax=Fusarium agapanthi TaxID=1803897 RepID=A0A9P5BII0_9HYPO|nr:hypothetical protein FAGAP_1972 [Fusarium agapanthi]